MEPGHKEIYGRYLKKSHTWKRTIREARRSNYILSGKKCGYIITAFYIPEDTTELSIKIRYSSLTALIEWEESEQPIESILVESRRLPDFTEPGYKRIVPCEPFIFLPDNHREFEIVFDNSSWRVCYYEYYEIPDCMIRIPFPVRRYHTDLPWAGYIHIPVPTDIRKIGDRLRIDLINEVEDLCDDLIQTIYDGTDAWLQGNT